MSKQIFKVVCLNNNCDRTVEEYRLNNQNDNMSKWYFCIKCIRSLYVIEFQCRKESCNNNITFDGSSRAYCSSQCKSRHHYNTRENEMRQCIKCNKMFEGNLGYALKFCSDECRKVEKTFISSQTLIVQLLQRGDSNLERISSYIKKDYQKTRSLIYALRKKGHHITLSDYKGQYHYEGFVQ